MPHVRIEYTNDAQASMQALCDALLARLSAHDAIANPASIKVRALPVSHAAMGTEAQSFAHAQFALLPGRSAQTKQELGALILETMRAHLPDTANLSVDTHELGAAYVKETL